ncbi:metallophosphoesterase family protein [Metallibacterium scheffleri]|uniref:metallophosphoesterase family protein n=1 Tax=Metallibacterium scheffleri TaxID=993689 RepID=UPI001B371824|nr:DNA repair exonuclease [Metallibacterium scheffleri]
MNIQFIHTADVHLDRGLKGLTVQGDSAPELLTATRTAFVRLVDVAIDTKVAFMIIAGDLYDSDWNDFQTGYFFIGEMGRLQKAGIRVILLYGNHDAEQDMTKKLALPDNVLRFDSSKPSSIPLEDLKIVLHGQSFRRAATTDNLAAKYPPPVPGWVNIGVLHTALQGKPPHSPYAPCSLDELKNKGYAYWALGHVHQYEILAEDPWIVFPGNLQGLHVNEPGARGAVIVPIDDGAVGRPERLCVDVLRWTTVEVDAAGAAGIDQVAPLIGQALRKTVGEAEGRYVCCRVVLTGRTAAHGELFARGQQLAAEVKAQAIAAAPDKLIIEKIKVQTQPMLSPEEIAARGDAVAELQKIFDGAPTDQAFLESLRSDLEVLVGKLPPELADQDLPAVQCVKEGRLFDLIATVAPGVLDRVSRES